MKKRILCAVLCLCMLAGTLAMAGCSEPETAKPDAFVVMTEQPDGLFNPFFATSANDSNIVAMTQIGMLTTDYDGKDVGVGYGDSQAVVVKDYSEIYDEDKDQTVYTFVIKNNICFSDGHPLTMEDVLFNMYVYLDPVYTGSSTMYSTDILGLKNYRTQSYGASDNENDAIASLAASRAGNRIKELLNLYIQVGRTQTQGSYSASYDKMIAAIASHTVSEGYKKAISSKPSTVTNVQLKEDYLLTLKLFREELERDYVSAPDSFTEEPYKSHEEFADEVFCFMFLEGFVVPKYAKGADGKEDKTNIESFEINYPTTGAGAITTKEAAIEYVYNQKIENELNVILTYWGTANELTTRYTAQATSVILEERNGGELKIKNIEGIVSLGHTTDVKTVKIGSNTYTVAKEHNADGTPKNASEYDVLQITINGVDPKAIWNFAFSVAPQHYYAQGYDVDIENDKFGVDFGSFDFMRDVIQSTRNIKLPMGAGPYKVTDAQNSDNPKEDDFFKNNVVYFKRNDSFLMGAPKIEKLRYRVVSVSNAIAALKEGSVHYISPQYTAYNIGELDKMAADGIEKRSSDQLGYGYIGINAGKVKDINLRRAIMCAMDTSLALSYYQAGTAETIYWPMSLVSWAYPKDESGNPQKINGHDYPAVNFTEADAKETIRKYMDAAGVVAGDSELSIKFTIAGADLTDHPTYLTFRAAAELLNDMGWDIEVVADTQALTKLSTGSLAVWAAAWGTTVDPDMYQVYHKNSTATSVLAWGYREILASPTTYDEETEILNKLSDVIDEARETNDREERTELYEEAMGYVLDLAIELPVYQRDVLYAFNSKIIKSSTVPSQSEINPYTSPLDHIWEIELVD